MRTPVYSIERSRRQRRHEMPQAPTNSLNGTRAYGKVSQQHKRMHARRSMKDFRIFWGDTHHNTYQFNPSNPQDPPLDVVCRAAAQYTDFYAAAYYTGYAEAHQAGSHLSETKEPCEVAVEDWKPDERLAREWADVQRIMEELNEPGRFVTFPGYEWQGNGEWGDHNVFFRHEGGPLPHVDTIAELYAELREHDAIAIPHHIGYRPGRRAPRWSACDETISPFAEIFSKHGCSETDEELIGLRNNPHMGPGMGGSTYQDALNAGLHIGCICSTDSWNNVPAQHGGGVMACVAEELTRDSLWHAFRARRVYGVTGDRIALDFTVNDQPMGSVLDRTDKRVIRVRAVGADAIDRIEILRNATVLDTHCHQGAWEAPTTGRRIRNKLRLELGWGPRSNEIMLPDRDWQVELELADGKFVGWEPCWISQGQTPPTLAGARASFGMKTTTAQTTHPQQNANVLEFEAAPESELFVRINGLEERGPVASFANASRIMWFKDECIRMLQEQAGLGADMCRRQDPFYHMAYKAKLHRTIPEPGYTAELTIEDDEPLRAETHYRVRVEQRNGQRAWSSPIWVR